jgi:hypothetical protein
MSHDESLLSKLRALGDLRAWWPRIRSSGIIANHDYDMPQRENRPMLHLTDQPMLTDPALCGHQPDPADPDCIPLRWWNGNRDGVCGECLRLADCRQTAVERAR